MPLKKRLSRADKQAARDKKLAFIIIEVARATYDGHNVNQQDIKLLINQRWGLKLPDASLSGYVTQLAGPTFGRVWLTRDGQKVKLDSEDTILTDSNSIKALLKGVRLADDDDRVNVARWSDRCKREYGYSHEVCQKFVRDYVRCGYVIGDTGNDTNFQLDIRAINQQMFYLRNAAQARLKARPRRTHTPSPST